MFNLVVVLIGTFIIAFILIFFIASHDRRLQKKREQASSSPATADPTSSETGFRLFTKFCTELCEYLKLEISDLSRPHDNEIVIRAKNSAKPILSVEYLIVGFHLPENAELEAGKIMEISDQIVSERISKGIVITSGKIPTNVKHMPELAPMEFIDGTGISEWQKKIIL